ncbi:MAG: HEAT repeat domain-containing protein [Planctomycetota bacterium]|nr:HEAT repeat domain-containing protein [Planctomycetota bacterium]
MLRATAAASWLLAGLGILATAAIGKPGDTPTPAAEAYLSNVLNDPDSSAWAIATLKSTDDKRLLPLLKALARCGDEHRRRVATAALGELAGDEAVEALLERIHKDTARQVRREAAVRLAQLRQIPPSHLVEMLQDPDETIRCLAARGLLRRGHGQAAAETLRQLTGSKDLATACMGRVSLLGMGRREQLAPLRKLVQNDQTPPGVLMLLMEQIVEDKTSAAAELAEALTGPDKPVPLRLAAYRAISTVSDRAPVVMGNAIRNSRHMVFRVRLLNILASSRNAGVALRAVSERNETVGLLARFELMRADRPKEAADLACRVIAAGHPVVVGYLLDRARQDIDDRRAECGLYVPALRAYLDSFDSRVQTMQPEHVYVARAAALLIDLGEPQGLADLKKILAGRHCAFVRAVAAGLLQAKSRAACELARPLLKSPYSELVTDAALTLGRFGATDSAEHLRAMLENPGRYAGPEVVLASWYLLSIFGQPQAAAERLARQVR